MAHLVRVLKSKQQVLKSKQLGVGLVPPHDAWATPRVRIGPDMDKGRARCWPSMVLAISASTISFPHARGVSSEEME